MPVKTKTAKSTAAKSPVKKAKAPAKKKTALKLVAKAGPKKKAAAPKKHAAPKATAPKARPQPAKHTAEPAHGTNVIWKFLEMKEARRKAAQEAHEKGHAPKAPHDTRANTRHNSFAKFSGPRRRSTV